MVTSDSRTDGTDARDWALHHLGFNDLADSVDSISLLRFVARNDYVLSEETADAIQIAVQPLDASSSATNTGRQRRIAVLVKAFARDFFDFRPEERRNNWESLYEACVGIPSLQSWLDQLRCGLDVLRVPTCSNERINQLVSVSCAVFTAMPPAGIRLRQDYEAENLITFEDWQQKYEDSQHEYANWKYAVTELQSTHPVFLQTIAPWVETIPNRVTPGPDEIAQLRGLHNLTLKTMENVEPESGSVLFMWLGSIGVSIIIILIKLFL